MGRMRSFFKCWRSSLHKRVPRFSFGMMRLIGINNMLLWRNGGGTANCPDFLPFLAGLEILGLFLVLSDAILKSKILGHQNYIFVIFGELSELLGLEQRQFFCPNRIILSSFQGEIFKSILKTADLRFPPPLLLLCIHKYQTYKILYQIFNSVIHIRLIYVYLKCLF